MRPKATVLAALVFLIGIWSTVSALQLVSVADLPSPWTVWQTAAHVWTHPYGTQTLPLQALTSVITILTGYLSACVVGVVLGTAIALLPAFRFLAEPILSFMRPLPGFAFITVFIVWFGLGELPKVMLVFVGVLVPITVYTTTAMSALPPELADSARTLGARWWQQLLFVRLRAALPDILAGMRVLQGLAWTSVMGAELIAANSGLGWMIWNGMRYLDTPIIYVGIITIGILGAFFDFLLVLLTRLLVGNWAHRLRGG
jgi:ABC-type nitrate/sulfonate/bicarbonate transport system permease component